jgi:hypothetical protein
VKVQKKVRDTLYASAKLEIAASLLQEVRDDATEGSALYLALGSMNIDLNYLRKSLNISVQDRRQ